MLGRGLNRRLWFGKKLSFDETKLNSCQKRAEHNQVEILQKGTVQQLAQWVVSRADPWISLLVFMGSPSVDALVFPA